MEKRGIDLGYLLRGAIDLNVVIGPVLCRPPDVDGWYFIVAAADEQGFRCDQICTGTEDYQQASMDQAQIIMLLTQEKKLVMHLMDDELAMAQLCETLWPSARTTRLRQAVESERAA